MAAENNYDDRAVWKQSQHASNKTRHMVLLHLCEQTGIMEVALTVFF